MLGPQEHALDVYVDDLVPFLLGGVLDWGSTVYTSVVDKHVELTESVDSSFDGILPLGLDSHVETDEKRVAARLVDLGLDLLALIFKDIANYYGCPLGREQPCLGSTLSICATTDQTYLASESHRSFFPFLSMWKLRFVNCRSTTRQIRLLCRPSPVDDNFAAGHVRGLVRCQEQHPIRNLFGSAQPAERYLFHPRRYPLRI